jgi:hypothetical protein
VIWDRLRGAWCILLECAAPEAVRQKNRRDVLNMIGAQQPGSDDCVLPRVASTAGVLSAGPVGKMPLLEHNPIKSIRQKKT